MALLLVLAAECLSASVQQPDDRPGWYDPKQPQFNVYGAQTSNCLVAVRYGDGLKRCAEYTVLELVDNQSRVRRLWGATLQNRYEPLITSLSPDKRFLVTRDDWEGLGLPGCLAIYDMARGERKMWNLDDLVPKAEQVNLGQDGDGPPIRGISWAMGGVYWSPESDVAYVGKPLAERVGNKPFFEVHVHDRVVRRFSTPAPNLVMVKNPSPQEVPIHWQCSHGKEPEPRWSVPSKLPLLLRAVRNPRRPEGPLEQPIYFKHVSSGEYVRCEASEWPQK
jgi:hypothetical protein